MKQVLFLLTFLIVVPLKAENPDWGKTGHRTIADIANQYLKGKTKRKIAKLLDGKSLVLVSTFADEIKSDSKYRAYSVWHYVNKPFDVSYENATKNPNGDLIVGLEKCIAVLKDETSSKSDKAFHLKMLVHLIGDMHQPMHVGLKEDKGGNTFQVQWFGTGTNMHSLWDSKMINSYAMTYSELTENIPQFSKEKIKALQEGSLVDWINETGKKAEIVYASAKSGENLRNKYLYDYFQLTTEQLQKGGVRLAKILNDIFK
jgi:hypothetical protein